MDLPCDYAAVDVFSTIGYQKDIVKNIKKFPIDTDGVLQHYEQQQWHNNDIELWDPAVWQSIDDLHEDGEDAIRLHDKSFHYGERAFAAEFLFTSIRHQLTNIILFSCDTSSRQLPNGIG